MRNLEMEGVWIVDREDETKKKTMGFEKEKETNRRRSIRKRKGRKGGWRAEDEKLNQRGKGLRGYFPTFLLPTGKINITLETLLFFCWGPGGPQGIPRLWPIREWERLENWRGQTILWPGRRLADRVWRSWKQVIYYSPSRSKKDIFLTDFIRYCLSAAPQISRYCWMLGSNPVMSILLFFFYCSLLWPQDTRRTRIRNDTVLLL